MDYLIESSCNPMAKILSTVSISEVKLEFRQANAQVHVAGEQWN